MKVLLLYCTVILILIIIMLFSTKEKYDECEGRCFKIDGEISDVYDCCRCRATFQKDYGTAFRKCMCDQQYKNYCFIPVTNTLLSQ